MGYFDSVDHVKGYIEMTKDYSGREMVEYLREYLERGASLLELGMGPGRDLDMLREVYDVTGSDSSQVFIDLYREQHPSAKLLKVDAVTMAVDKPYDGIYSNKVLHHLSTEDLTRSVLAQANALASDGIIFHTFWRGDSVEFYEDLRFVYYEKADLEQLFSGLFDIRVMEYYDEEEADDSILLIAKKKEETYE